MRTWTHWITSHWVQVGGGANLSLVRRVGPDEVVVEGGGAELSLCTRVRSPRTCNKSRTPAKIADPAPGGE